MALPPAVPHQGRMFCNTEFKSMPQRQQVVATSCRARCGSIMERCQVALLPVIPHQGRMFCSDTEIKYTCSRGRLEWQHPAQPAVMTTMEQATKCCVLQRLLFQVSCAWKVCLECRHEMIGFQHALIASKSVKPVGVGVML